MLEEVRDKEYVLRLLAIKKSCNFLFVVYH